MSQLEDAFELQLRAAKAGVWTREHLFAKEIGRKFRLDFAWLDQRVAVEIDGGSWNGGRHTRGLGFENDAEKLSLAAAMGWRILRLTGRMVKDGWGLTLLEQALAWSPTEDLAS